MTNIAFSHERYKRVKERYDRWWQGKSDTPILGATVLSRPPKIKQPKMGYLCQANVDLTTPVDDVIDSIEYVLSMCEYLGDAFPMYNMDSFGPGVLAAILGGKLDNSSGRVWFHRNKAVPASELTFSLSEDNPWLRRMIQIYRRANERFEGLVRFGMPDLGGILDVLSSFFPSEELLLLLYDEPEEVKRLTAELCREWHKAYEIIAKEAEFDRYGYTDWSGIYSSVPSYVLQCDFCYMISSAMFDEFALPGLKYSCDKLDRTIYHLDGINELQHLNSLLSIPTLSAVQWVPGTGQKPVDEWMDVYRQIIEGGKLAQVLNHGYERFDRIVEEVGQAGKFLYQYDYCPIPKERREDAVRWIQKYGVEL